MANIHLHPATRAQIEVLGKDLPQSLLISGQVGVGLAIVAKYIATEVGALPQIVLPEKDEKVDLEKGTISVDIIRRLYAATKTVETGKRIMIIDYAERMGTQAQNAFLKLLEEPGKNTYFMLLTHEPGRLLPTIRSRTQQLDVRPVTKEQSEEVLNGLKVFDAKKRSQLLFMASGLPAELHRLVADEKYFESRAEIVRDAQQFLKGSPYERLILAQQYKESRAQALLLLDDAMKLLQKNIAGGRTDLILKIDELLKAYERIAANGNVRLQLAAVMV